jgi:hypothetical protein
MMTMKVFRKATSLAEGTGSELHRNEFKNNIRYYLMKETWIVQQVQFNKNTDLEKISRRLYLR